MHASTAGLWRPRRYTSVFSAAMTISSTIISARSTAPLRKPKTKLPCFPRVVCAGSRTESNRCSCNAGSTSHPSSKSFAVIFRASTWRWMQRVLEEERFDPALPINEHVELSARIAATFPIQYTPDTTTVWVTHEQNTKACALLHSLVVRDRTSLFLMYAALTNQRCSWRRQREVSDEYQEPA